jgi:hypothetical protein
MRLSILKDLFVVASLFVGTGFAGASLVHSVQQPTNDSTSNAAVCAPASNEVALSPDIMPTTEDFLCS